MQYRLQMLCCIGACINITILLDVMPCIMIHKYQHFGKECCLRLQDIKVSRERRNWYTYKEAKRVMCWVSPSAFSLYLYHFPPPVSLYDVEGGGSRFLRNFVMYTKLHGVITQNILILKCWNMFPQFLLA